MASITIIDDDKEFAADLAESLTKEGNSVTVLNSTEKAIEALIAHKPDLLILDVMFPENPVAGFELARKIRLRKDIKSLPIILLTAVNQEFPMDFSAKDIDKKWMPVHDFMEKPVKADELLKKIKKLIRLSSH